MIRLVVIVVSIGIVDSLNPTTIGPALYLATTPHARLRVAEFALGIFAVNLIGGALIALGPGQLLLSLIPHPKPTARHVSEVVVGAAIVVAAAVVWWQRKRLTSKPRSSPIARTGAGFTLGAGITLIEFPTAFPYFAAIAAIVASGVSIGEQAILLTLFNVAFILPVLGVLGVLMAFGARSDRALGAARDWLQRNWPIVVAVLGLIVGSAIIGLGIRGLITW